MTKTSRYNYADTVARLTNALNESGNRVFATIDQAAAAASVGLTLRPTVSVAYETMSEIAKRYGVTGLDDRIATIDGALDKLAGSVT